MLKHSLIALAAMGAGLIGFSGAEASAFTPVSKAPAIAAGTTNPYITEVRDHRRACRRSHRCRHYYRGHYYANPWWILPMIGAGIALSDRDRYHHGYGRRHVEWCLDRYRSYDPRSNTWVAYSGRVHQCISPYGP